MNYTRKISSTIVILSILGVFLGVPIILYWLPVSWYHLKLAVESRGCLTMGDFVPIISLFGLIFGLLAVSGVLYYIIVRVVRPIGQAAEFADAIARGDQPPPLKYATQRNDEVCTLFMALNILHDRQQNLATRLKKSLLRESESRHEMEHQESLQLQILTRMLPELRQPLNAIKGFLQLSKMENSSSEAVRQCLTEAELRVGELARQIERMVDISRLERSRWDSPHLESFDTSEFLHELVNFSSFSLKEHSLSLMNHFSASAPASLCLDRGQLLQLLNIMLRSLARSAEEGETLVISCFRENGLVVFEVRDSKVGKCRERLVENYNLLKETPSGSEDGNGRISLSVIGLRFIRGVAKRMGAQIRVHSTSEANVVIRLEFNEAECVDRESQWSHSAWHESTGGIRIHFQVSEEKLNELPEQKILLYDNYPDDEFILRPMLAKFHMVLQGTGDQKEFFRLAEEGKFGGFIVADCNEREALLTHVEKLRKIDPDGESPIVVISPRFPDDVSRRIAEIKNLFYMTKPLHFELLIQQLRPELFQE